MQRKSISDSIQFSADKMNKVSLFSTERMFYDLYCLEPGQAQKIHSHTNSDKVYLLLEGSAVVTVGDEEQTLSIQEAVLAPAGVPHGVRSLGERAVLLVVTTPPPSK